MGPKPRSYRYTLNKKVRALAVRSALSAKAASGELILVQGLKATEYKTKTVVAMLKALSAEKKPLIVTADVDKLLVASANNIEGAKTAVVGALNTYDVLNSCKLILAVEAADKLEEVYA